MKPGVYSSHLLSLRDLALHPGCTPDHAIASSFRSASAGRRWGRWSPAPRFPDRVSAWPPPDLLRGDPLRFFDLPRR